jgi:hypothetical protein
MNPAFERAISIAHSGAQQTDCDSPSVALGRRAARAVSENHGRLAVIQIETHVIIQSKAAEVISR